MPAFLMLVFRFFRLLLSGHQAIAIENTALRMQIAAFQRKKKRPVLTTFDRMFWITLRSLWSDSDLGVSIFVPDATGPATWHFAANQTSYVSPPGDFTGSLALPVASTTQAWFWLASIEVTNSRQTGAIVAFGDSITDGNGSTAMANNRWPDHLARRLLAQPGNRDMGVLNQGLAGNRVSHDGIGSNALARFDREVLTRTGVKNVIVLEGNNDFLFVFNPVEEVHYNQVIEGLKQLVHRATLSRAHDLRRDSDPVWRIPPRNPG